MVLHLRVFNRSIKLRLSLQARLMETDASEVNRDRARRRSFCSGKDNLDRSRAFQFHRLVSMKRR